MTSPSDLPDRIARLERLLHDLAASRAVPASRHAPAARVETQPLDRLSELVAMVRRRLTESEMDEVDLLAMRALLEEYRSITSDLRRDASAIAGRLTDIDTRAADARSRLAAFSKLD